MSNAKYDQEFVEKAIQAFQGFSVVDLDKDVDVYLSILNDRKDGNEKWKETFWSFYKLNNTRKSSEIRDWYFAYFDECDDRVDKCLDFDKVHAKICDVFEGDYISCTTALMNTINPKYPLCHTPIINAMEERSRIDNTLVGFRSNSGAFKYRKLLETYYGMFLSGEADRYIEAFNARFLHLRDRLDDIPNSKKVDYVLWAYGMSPRDRGNNN